jgi:hypothetical protein
VLWKFRSLSQLASSRRAQDETHEQLVCALPDGWAALGQVYGEDFFQGISSAFPTAAADAPSAAAAAAAAPATAALGR